MRLNVSQQNALKQVFGHLPGEVFLFGSRVNMNRKGGDIDILWITENKEFRSLKKEMELTIQFQKILDEIKIDGYKIKLNSVVLNTAGGSPSAAIAIGKIVRKEKLNTYVGPKHRCGSACIYILSSGIIRMAYGEVTVHRTTYEDGYPTEKLEKSLKQTDVDNANHLFEMGMATQLVDAIRITPNYTNWKLDDKEKRRWGVHGTERLYEELWFRSTAKAKFYDTDVVRDFFYKHNEKCTKIAKEFKMTVFDCVKAEM
jgi:hypothetical protein